MASATYLHRTPAPQKWDKLLALAIVGALVAWDVNAAMIVLISVLAGLPRVGRRRDVPSALHRLELSWFFAALPALAVSATLAATSTLGAVGLVVGVVLVVALYGARPAVALTDDGHLQVLGLGEDSYASSDIDDSVVVEEKVWRWTSRWVGILIDGETVWLPVVDGPLPRRSAQVDEFVVALARFIDAGHRGVGTDTG